MVRVTFFTPNAKRQALVLRAGFVEKVETIWQSGCLRGPRTLGRRLPTSYVECGKRRLNKIAIKTDTYGRPGEGVMHHTQHWPGWRQGRTPERKRKHGKAVKELANHLSRLPARFGHAGSRVAITPAIAPAISILQLHAQCEHVGISHRDRQTIVVELSIHQRNFRVRTADDVVQANIGRLAGGAAH